MTGGQRRMIFKLADLNGLDNDTLHLYIKSITGKTSLTKLTVREATKVIDGLKSDNSASDGMITFKQRRFIEGLAADLGWLTESKKLDMVRLNTWLYNKYHISDINWLTSKKASNAIEGLKAMVKRVGQAAEAAL